MFESTYESRKGYIDAGSYYSLTPLKMNVWASKYIGKLNQNEHIAKYNIEKGLKLTTQNGGRKPTENNEENLKNIIKSSYNTTNI